MDIDAFEIPVYSLSSPAQYLRLCHAIGIMPLPPVNSPNIIMIAHAVSTSVPIRIYNHSFFDADQTRNDVMNRCDPDVD